MHRRKGDGVIESVPIIDIDHRSNEAPYLEACASIAECFESLGIVIVRTSQFSDTFNESLLSLLEGYFEQPEEKLLADARPNLAYQTGVTPSFTERPRNHAETIGRLAEQGSAPHLPQGADPKWRFFWRIGPRPLRTEYPELNAEQVVPAAFVDQWASVMDCAGQKLLDAAFTVAEMAAIGFGLPPSSITDLMKFGPHLLAPTASDLSWHGKLNTVLAGFHYDLNLITVHGRSRYPGLYIWTRNGERVLVRVPPGCLLLQAGKQLEWLTGGRVLCGFHEVVVAPETISAIADAQAHGRSLWRISSTCFAHVASDCILEPLGKFSTSESRERYPRTAAGLQVQRELEAINLARKMAA